MFVGELQCVFRVSDQQVSSYARLDMGLPVGVPALFAHKDPGMVNLNIKLWKITIFDGKTHYFYGHVQ